MEYTQAQAQDMGERLEASHARENALNRRINDTEAINARLHDQIALLKHTNKQEQARLAEHNAELHKRVLELSRGLDEANKLTVERYDALIDAHVRVRKLENTCAALEAERRALEAAQGTTMNVTVHVNTDKLSKTLARDIATAAKIHRAHVTVTP